MTPATDAIMGALPPEQFGVGSAVNDTVREIGGAFGVADPRQPVRGGLRLDDGRHDRLAGLPAEAAAAARDSLGGAAAVAAAIGGEAGAALLAQAQAAFVDAMSMTSLIGIGFAVAGALVAFIWLPDRATTSEAPAAGAGEPSARAWPRPRA